MMMPSAVLMSFGPAITVMAALSGKLPNPSSARSVPIEPWLLMRAEKWYMRSEERRTAGVKSQSFIGSLYELAALYLQRAELRMMSKIQVSSSALVSSTVRLAKSSSLSMALK